MGNYTIFWMFENPRRGRQARNFITNAPKILDLKSSSEQIFSRKLPLGAPGTKRLSVLALLAVSLLQSQEMCEVLYLWDQKNCPSY